MCPYTVTDRKGQETDYSYPDRQTTQVSYYKTGHTFEATVSTTTDDLGRITQVSDSSVGSIDYTYTDSAQGEYPDRVKSVTDTQGTVSYTYDDVGRRASMTVLGQPTVHYTYTQSGQLSSIVFEHNGTMEWDFHYDPENGQLEQISFPGGGGQSFTYDGAGRIASAGGETYTYDANGNVVQVYRGGSTNPELGAPVLPTATNVVYDAANRITSLNGQAVTYDANGNLTQWGNRTYTWDARNRLVAISEPGVLTASFTYDALGRRISKTINNVTSTYVYDGQDIVQETTGGVTYFYVRTLNVDEPLARIGTDGTIYYYHLGALGSVLSLTGGTNQTDPGVRTRYKYSPFGETVEIDGQTPADQPFRFTGREWDGDTGLYYYRARYYSPIMKRFISEDPMGYAAGDVNFYRYVGNRPLNMVDPRGRNAYDCKKPLDALGGSGTRSGPDVPGNPLYHEYICVKINGHFVCGGKTSANHQITGPGAPSSDVYVPDRCEEKSTSDCMDMCLLGKFGYEIADYNLFTANCQDWAEKTWSDCQNLCSNWKP